jgi:hypothetical protein
LMQARVTNDQTPKLSSKLPGAVPWIVPQYVPELPGNNTSQPCFHGASLVQSLSPVMAYSSMRSSHHTCFVDLVGKQAQSTIVETTCGRL